MHTIYNIVGLIVGLIVGYAPLAMAETVKDPSGATTVQCAVLQVNDDALTSSQMIAEPELREQLVKWAGELEREPFLGRAHVLVVKSVRDKIFDLLLYQHAFADLKKHDNYEQVIESTLADERKRLIGTYNGVEARAQEELAKQGTSLEEELEAIKRRMVVQSYRETYFLPTQQITRGQMLQYYRQNKEEKFQQGAEIQFQLIDIQAKMFLDEAVMNNPNEQQMTGAREKARGAADEAWQKIQGGTDFGEVVKEYSHGYRKSYEGLWRPVAPNALQEQYKPIAKALEGKEPGETSGIIEGEDRYFIAKLIASKEQKLIPFSEAQFTILEDLRREQWNRHIGKLYLELLEKATLGDIEKFVKETCVAAYDMLKQKY
jgi:parvulin-like peptidyl-prolyl isomerase